MLSEVSDESEVRKRLPDKNIKSLIKGEEYFNTTTIRIVLVMEKNTMLILICSNKTTSDTSETSETSD